MFRIRWTDPADDPDAEGGWKLPSLVLATLFLNFVFWSVPANHFGFDGSAAVFLASLGMVAAMVFVLFYLAPAFAAHEARRSLFQVVEASFGVVPAIGFCIGCAALCVLWIAGGCGVWMFNFLRFLLQRDLPLPESCLLSGLLMLFLFATGLQGICTIARLACFSNERGAALLIAAAIRVREYLPGAWSDLGTAHTITETVWSRIANSLMFTGPMALLAADFGGRCRTRKDAACIGTFGLAVPMAVTLFVVSLIQRAAYRGHTNLGGLANIAVALWGDDSVRYLPQWMALALITLFGLARFGVYMWRAAVVPLARGRKLRLAVLAVTILVGAVLSMSDSPMLSRGLNLAAPLAASIAAILSADYLARRWRAKRTPAAVDWPSIAALAAGWTARETMSFWAGADHASHLTASILTPYAASFAFCLLGGAIQSRTEPGSS